MKRDLESLLQEIKNTKERLAFLKSKASELTAHIYDSTTGVYDKENGSDIDQYTVSLLESEIRDRNIEDESQIGIWSYDFESLDLYWSEEVYEIYEYEGGFDGTLADFFMSCMDPVSVSRFRERGVLLRTSKDKQILNQFIITPKGNTKYLSFTSIPILNKKGEITGAEGIVTDLTDRIIGKKGLDNFFNLSSDLHCIVHTDRYFVKVSPAWSKLLGYTEKEILSSSFLDFIHPDDVEKSTFDANDLDPYGIMTFENRYVTKSGEIVYLSWNSRLDKSSQLAYCTARDITASKKVQEDLLSDLSEKELLLKEIHHRVKNNLQIISSLLSLQAGANRHQKELNKLYEDSRNRIKSMAAIHEMFYQSKELDKIEFGKYLDKLIGDLSKSISSSHKSIDLSLNVESVFVTLDVAIPLGLIINEIVTNAIKHGADENNEVKIFVHLEVVKEGHFELIIGDKGCQGLQDILNEKSESLGVMLINSLVEQINGEIIQLTDYPGTVYKLIFFGRI